MPKQVKFYDSENQTHCGGILMEDGSIVCGCCGAVFNPDYLEDCGIIIVRVYERWVNISAEITGDED